MLFFPYAVDVPTQRWPLANWALIALTCAVSISVLAQGGPDQPWMVIGPGDDFSIAGLLGSLFIHLGAVHLIGNMVFLFVFGNAVNAKLGHLRYLGCYLLVGVIEGLLWSLLADGPAAGASGAIMGIMGMFVVLYPRNEVTVFYWFYYVYDTFEISAYVLIVVYFIFDLWGVVSGGSQVAYLAHVAGFLAGFLIASGLVLSGLIESDDAEEHLYEMLSMTRRG